MLEGLMFHRFVTHWKKAHVKLHDWRRWRPAKDLPGRVLIAQLTSPPAKHADPRHTPQQNRRHRFSRQCLTRLPMFRIDRSSH